MMETAPHLDFDRIQMSINIGAYRILAVLQRLCLSIFMISDTFF
jgi:hypothetical protein